MTLHDTIEMMESPDWRERFKAEYYQLKIRYERLHEMICKWEDGKLDITPSNTLEVHKQQRKAMRQYLLILKVRAENEGIELK